MQATNNWVKDGLDAYLSLTGEKRAQDKADADLAAQKHAQSVQDDSLQIAKNQDARSSLASGLTNQLTQQQVDEGNRKASDKDKFSKSLQDFITMKTASDPSIPNSLDPAELSAAKQNATDLAHTAELLNNMPLGSAELNLQSLPLPAQKVLMAGPGIAAQMRKGTVHKDPATGEQYTMTGEMGPVRVVREEGQPTRVIPTMLAVKPDGTTFEVPYTDGKSNDPNDPVKYVTPDMLTTRAGATLAAIQQAEQTGIVPSVAYSQNIYKMVQALPYEQQVAWMQGEITKETTRREKFITDAQTERDAKPYADQINKLTGTPEEKRAATVALMVGAPSAVVDHLAKTSKAVHDMFPDSKKTAVIASTGTGVYSVDGTDGSVIQKIGGPTKVPGESGGGDGKTPAQNKSYELWKQVFIKQGMSETEAHNQALRVATEGKANPQHEIASLANTLLKESLAKSIPDALRQAREAYGVGNDKPSAPTENPGSDGSLPSHRVMTTPPPKPSARGLSQSAPSAASFDMRNRGNGQPKTATEQIYNLNHLN